MRFKSCTGSHYNKSEQGPVTLDFERWIFAVPQMTNVCLYKRSLLVALKLAHQKVSLMNSTTLTFPNAPADWSPGLADIFASTDGLSLNDDHCRLIQSLQEYYSRNEFQNCVQSQMRPINDFTTRAV